jgi:hypothetical protein
MMSPNELHEMAWEDVLYQKCADYKEREKHWPTDHEMQKIAVDISDAEVDERMEEIRAEWQDSYDELDDIEWDDASRKEVG